MGPLATSLGLAWLPGFLGSTSERTQGPPPLKREDSLTGQVRNHRLGVKCSLTSSESSLSLPGRSPKALIGLGMSW